MIGRLLLTMATLCVVLGAVAWGQRAQLAAARREVAALQAEAAQARLAADVLDAHLRRVDQERATLQASIEELSRLEGANAPLSPYLRAVLGRVR